jgi:hypothetical protein
VVALLFARLAWTRAAPGFAVLAVPGWLVAVAVARHRIRALDRAGHDAGRDAGRGSSGRAGRGLPLLALALLSTAVFGMALVVLP